MFGKASLLLVLGFSMIFLVLGQNFGRISVRAVDNFSQYHDESLAYNLAVSGANIAANKIFLDPTWTAGYSDLPFQDGTINVNVQILDAVKNIRQINSTGIFDKDTSIVQVTLQPSKFSKFAYYSVYEPPGIWWTNGDTVFGPLHTQDYLRVQGHPVFEGKTTTKYGIYRYGPKKFNNPILNGGYEQGVDLPLPANGISNLETVANSGGYTFTGHDTVYITFVSDSIKYKFAYNGPTTTQLTNNLTPNGVIFADNSIVRIQGTVEGRVTVGVSGSGGKGTVYIDNNIVYKDDPRTNPNSTDMLGIVAKNNIYISDNLPNRSNISIDAALYAETGGFGAQNYNSRPNSGTIYLYGGITEYSRKAVGTFNSHGIAHGYNKNYKYDERLMYTSPPSYPNTGSFEIVSWYEQNSIDKPQ